METKFENKKKDNIKENNIILIEELYRMYLYWENEDLL